jgi:hypothetical protein
MLRLTLVVVLVVVAIAAAGADTVTAQAVGQSLLEDLSHARAVLQDNRSPWEDPAARPQAEPVAVLASELPGYRIWLEFKPVDKLVREACRAQWEGYIDKDAGMTPRRDAVARLDELSAAIRAERPSYTRPPIRTAYLQVGQLDYALKHMEYNASMCLLWSMADILGLWDRQAALEVAERHLAELRRDGAGRRELAPRKAQRMIVELDAITMVIKAALDWRPLTEGIPVECTSGPARHTCCLSPCPERYRDWQYILDDFRYGWVVDHDTSADPPWDRDCDWRRLHPQPTWPGAGGVWNAGGL